MTSGFVSSNLEVARLRRKLSISELAKRAEVSTKELHRIISGSVDPRKETVEAVSNALEYPVSFFFGPRIDLPKVATFRKYSSLTDKDSGAGKASAALATLLTRHLDNHYQGLPSLDVPELDVSSADVAAEALREHWRLRNLPISNMVALLEAKGVRVYSLSEDTAKLNAFATWIDDVPYVLLNDFKSAESSRFDAAHELAHLCLHREGQQGPEVEDQANRMASAFLMPKADVLANRVYPMLDKLIELKARWGVSLSALLHRYRDLGLVSEDRAKFLYIEMSRKGYLRKEPRPMRRESSMVWKRVFEDLWKDRRQLSDLADDLGLPVDEVASLTFAHVRQADPRTSNSSPKLRVV